MNNGKLTLDALSLTSEDRIGPLKEREAHLVKVLEAIKGVVETREWSSLKTLIFDSRLEETRKAIFLEARKETPNLQILAKLNGKYEEVRKYANLHEFAKTLEQELTSLRLKIHGTSDKS